jgi:hypothetical protein
MRKFGRVFVPVTVAAVALAGPMTIGASSASSAQPSAVSAVSGSVASRPITCNPDELRAKAQAHAQKATEYEAARTRESSKANPSLKKIAYYERKSRAHTQKADAYLAKANQCEAAGSEL